MSSQRKSHSTGNATSSPASEASPKPSVAQDLAQIAMFGPGDFPARTSPLPESARAWLEADPASTSTSRDLLHSLAQILSSQRTSPVSLAPMGVETLQSFWEDLPESYRQFLTEAGGQPGFSADGSTPSPIGFSMRSISEWPSDAAVCSLSQVLLHEDDPWVQKHFKTAKDFLAWLQKYYLSAKACMGILRRAAKRGKELPEALARVLKQVAFPEQTKQLTDT